MKNLIILSLIFLFSLSWCSLLGNSSSEKRIQENQISTWVQSTCPKQEGLWLNIIQRQKQFDSLLDLPDTLSKRVKINWVEWFSSVHNYKDLGIKIYTEDPYSQSFKQEPPFIIKNGSMLVDPFNPWQYIKIIAKDTNETIQQIFNRDYISEFETGCTLLELDKRNLTWNLSAIETYTVSSNNWMCKAGWNGMHQNYVWFLYNKNNPDRYYLYDYTDGCAPGKCNVFNQIELY
jgi:hypothetical protein